MLVKNYLDNQIKNFRFELECYSFMYHNFKEKRKLSIFSIIKKISMQPIILNKYDLL